MKQTLKITLSLYFLSFFVVGFSQTNLVKDIAQGFEDLADEPTSLTHINGIVYFAGENEYGKELWKSDGTELGTVMVKDIYPGEQGSELANFVEMNGILYFTAKKEYYSPQLWRSDGTEAGTYQLSNFFAGGYVSNIAVMNGYVYVSGTDSLLGSELFKSDGTIQGTTLVKDIRVGSPSGWPGNLFTFQGAVYFSASSTIGNYELWKTDGSISGTTLVKDIYPGSTGSYPQSFFANNGELYFTAEDGVHGREMWKSDGTGTGTVLLKDIRPGSADAFGPGVSQGATRVAFNGLFYFIANDGGGSQVWKTDGTTSGTTLMTDLWTLPGQFGSVSSLSVANNQLFFYETNSMSSETSLWKSDGSVAGTEPMLDTLMLNGTGLFSFNDNIYFVRLSVTGSTYELWKSDGTAVGTNTISDLQNNICDFFSSVISNNELYFRGENRLWKTNGNSGGTLLVKKLYEKSTASSPSYLTTINNMVYFLAEDSIHGVELWKTDGTYSGTNIVLDIVPGTGSAFGGYFPKEFVEYNGELYFVAWDTIHRTELWKTDGTAGGTMMVKNIAPDTIDPFVTNLTVYNGFLYFVADNGVNGYCVWKSDGTETGTQLFSDPLPGATPNYYSQNPTSFIDKLVVCNQNLYFVAKDSSHGTELWKSDGTSGGTSMLRDIRPGVLDSYPSMLTISDSLLFFVANNGTVGAELWKTDGTYAGTTLVSDVYPGSANGNIQSLVDVDGTVFFVATSVAAGRVLWKSDGTSNGTVIVKDIYTGSSSLIDDPISLTNVNGTLFFSANDGIYGSELWKSDGTEIGTVQISDINPGIASSDPDNLKVINGKLYFSARNITTGVEVFSSDGTFCSTQLVSDIFQGNVSSFPKNFTQLGNEVLFSASNLLYGEELWRLTPQQDTLFTQDFAISSCNPYLWVNNQVYDSTGYYIDTLQNIYGCDSLIITLAFQINSTDSSFSQISCDSYTWLINGQTYTISGQYMDTIPNAAGCDSIVILNLTILNSTSATETQTACDSYTWPINNQTYTISGQYTDTIPNTAGCDSIITLDLTIIPSLPLTIESSFSIPSDANSCVGEIAIDLSGNAPFELDFDNGSQIINSSGYSLVTGLCAGIHDLHVTDNCGDTLSTTIVIPVDSNYVFNNPFIDSLAQDSLGVTMTNCDIYYAGIDTAYIDSIWATGNTVNVIWNIVDSNGSNFDTTSYVLNNGNGIYWLQLSAFCPFKSVGEYFTVTEAVYFNNGSVSTAGLADIGKNFFAIYPNPTNDQVHISFSGPDAELTVYDVQGKMVLKDQIQNQEIISLQNFERGVYLFDFKNSQGHFVQRVIKQ